MNQTLHDIIQKEDQAFISEIVRSENVPFLIEKLKKTKNEDRKAIIQARIENLNHLLV